MIIAYDTFFLAKHFRNVGIYEYAKNLLDEFHVIAREQNAVSIRYFVCPGYSDDVVLGKGFAVGCEPVNTRLLRHHRLWRAGLVTAAARSAGADLIFTPSPNIFPNRRIPVAVTIHDAMAKRLTSELIERRVRLKGTTWLAAKLAEKIVTDSEHSKKDLIELYDLPSQKISVVYLGYDRRTFNSSPPESHAHKLLLTKLGIRGPYILHHGMVQARKNLSRLIQAYKLLLRRRPSLGFQLALAGPLGLGSEQIIRLGQEPVTNGSVVFTGALESQDLASLIKGASLCVIPSLYEGFCLPMVEAMACGVPTIAANSSCLPEVSGGVLRYFDPMSEEDMANVMESAIEDSELRQKLASRGLERASEFSWRRCAQETLMVLANLKRSSLGEGERATCSCPTGFAQ